MKTTIVAVVGIIASITAAHANCYEAIGCSDSQRFPEPELRRLSCQALYDVRNIIYKENGYCFATERAIAAFGNEGCTVTNQAQVRLKPTSVRMWR
jgi:hypothetical protein